MISASTSFNLDLPAIPTGDIALVDTNSHTSKQNTTAGIRKLVFVLLVLAIAGVAARTVLLDRVRSADGDSLWRLIVDVTVNTDEGSLIRLWPPLESAGVRLVQQSLWHPDFTVQHSRRDDDQRRPLVAQAKRGGRYNITYEFTLEVLPARRESAEHSDKLPASAKMRNLANSDLLQLDHPLVRKTANRLVQDKAPAIDKAEAIYRYVLGLPADSGPDALRATRVLSSGKATPLDRAVTMVALGRAAGLPARLVSGVKLQEDVEVRPQHWVQVHTGTGWRDYDFRSNQRGVLPPTYVILRFNDSEILDIENGKLVKLELGAERDLDQSLLKQQKLRRTLNIFDLTRLPAEKREDLTLLLLLPFGALVTALCRHLAGLHSYGVFTPTLLALALVYTDIISTLGVLLVICLLAIGGRSIFPDSISRIPRLAIIFTLVAIILSLLVSTLDYLQLQQEGKVILLPTIILTTLIDRMYRTIEDRGVGIATRRLVWTIFITLLCLPVITFEELGKFILRYPETHLVTLAVFLLISTYKGKQLIHLPVIRYLSEPKTGNRKVKKPGEYSSD